MNFGQGQLVGPPDAEEDKELQDFSQLGNLKVVLKASVNDLLSISKLISLAITYKPLIKGDLSENMLQLLTTIKAGANVACESRCGGGALAGFWRGGECA